ncbi:Fic family protein [Desulfococcaceae bacterium OttesenSCG-928-F15]|nr:Fic family protein [Desulfococcaceae bacterium OttesenSCG-928-F15]
MQDEKWQSYLYPNGTLRNKFGIQNPSQLRVLEYELVKKRTRELKLNPVKGNFDLKHLQKIHNSLFQDIYEWAGEIRNVDMRKGDSVFCKISSISQRSEEFHKALKENNFLKDLEKSSFIRKLAVFYGEMNIIHPFREGNGRATRQFFTQLSQEVGYDLGLRTIDKGLWNWASEQSFQGSDIFLEKIFEKSVRPLRAVSYEIDKPADAIKKYPELVDAYAAQEVFKKFLAKKTQWPASEKQAAAEKAQARIQDSLDKGMLPSGIKIVPPEGTKPRRMKP